jgi:hypothetical protein
MHCRDAVYIDRSKGYYGHYGWGEFYCSLWTPCFVALRLFVLRGFNFFVLLVLDGYSSVLSSIVDCVMSVSIMSSLRLSRAVFGGALVIGCFSLPWLRSLQVFVTAPGKQLGGCIFSCVPVRWVDSSPSILVDCWFPWRLCSSIVSLSVVCWAMMGGGGGSPCFYQISTVGSIR